MLDKIRARGFEVGFLGNGVFVTPERKLTLEQRRWIDRHHKELYAELWKETSPENKKAITLTRGIIVKVKKMQVPAAK